MRTLLIALSAFAATPAAAQQQVNMDRPMLPYALSYAACAHRSIESCEPLRKAMITHAERTLRLYEPNDMLQVRQSFARLLAGIDRGAAKLRTAGERPSSALVGYMQCLGDAMLGD